MEVQHNGTWGLVCNYGWDLNDAQVLCNQLGFGRATAAPLSVLYGLDRTRIWLSYLSCIGNEKAIGNCSHPGWGYRSYCYYGASVKCSSGKLYLLLSCFIVKLIRYYVL